MPTVSLHIPQIGEGLREARLVAVLKQPGDRVQRDEPIYQMETDKAVMDVESPYDGTLEAWLAQVDDVLLIGAEVARMQVAEGVEEIPPQTEPEIEPTVETVLAKPIAPARRTDIPPRTRAYAKERGVTDEQLATIEAAGSKLMPTDIDAFLSAGAAASTTVGPGYDEQPLSQKQRLLASRLTRGSQLVVPGTMSVVMDWGPIERRRARQKATGSEFQPSAFTMFAFAVARALRDFPAFRSSLVGESTLRTYRHANLGIAVGLPGDELVIAVVDAADTLAWKPFAERCREQIELARQGKDQANESVTISLTNMQAFGVRDAAPVVVPPAVATLFLGEAYTGVDPSADGLKPMRLANMALAFDHRLINGVGASQFLASVRKNVEGIDALLDGAA